MLFIAVSIFAQQKTERYWGLDGERYKKTYTLNKNGDYVGSYKVFDISDNCVLSYNYNSKGELAGDQYEYAYPNKPRLYQKYSATGGILLQEIFYEYDLLARPMKQRIEAKKIYDKDGHLIEEWHYKSLISNERLVKTWWTIPNGEASLIGEEGTGRYEDGNSRSKIHVSLQEKYTNNKDTVYVWYADDYEVTKQHFAGKLDRYGYWIIQYAKDGSVIYSREAEQAAELKKNEQARQDSIAKRTEINKLIQQFEQSTQFYKHKVDSTLAYSKTVDDKYKQYYQQYCDNFFFYKIANAATNKKHLKLKTLILQACNSYMGHTKDYVALADDIKKFEEDSYSISVIYKNGSSDKNILRDYGWDKKNQKISLPVCDDIKRLHNKYDRDDDDWRVNEKFANELYDYVLHCERIYDVHPDVERMIETKLKLIEIIDYCVANKIKLK